MFWASEMLMLCPDAKQGHVGNPEKLMNLMVNPGNVN